MRGELCVAFDCDEELSASAMMMAPPPRAQGHCVWQARCCRGVGGSLRILLRLFGS